MKNKKVKFSGHLTLIYLKSIIFVKKIFKKFTKYQKQKIKENKNSVQFSYSYVFIDFLEYFLQIFYFFNTSK